MNKIDVRIAYEPGAKLGADYNRIFAETTHKWVLLVDHDVLLVNPHWYYLCQMAIKNNPRCGLFTCYTNEIGNPEQRAPDVPNRDGPIIEHRRYAKDLFDKNLYSCSNILGNKCSGMFLLVSVKAHRQVGGFPGVGMFREDWTFGGRMVRAGIPVMRIDGLYVYHIRDRSWGSWIEGHETSKEVRDRVRSKK